MSSTNLIMFWERIFLLVIQTHFLVVKCWEEEALLWLSWRKNQ